MAVDANGRPSFRRCNTAPAHPRHTIVFYAFDLLHLNGRDLTGDLLDARPSPAAIGARPFRDPHVGGLPGSAPGHRRGAALGLEGVVAKRKSSRYTPGDRSASWLN